MNHKACLTLVALLLVATECRAQWEWSLQSGSLESKSFDNKDEGGSMPPADWMSNVWTTANGDFWVLRNQRKELETDMWRWSASEKKWFLLATSAKTKPVFEPPPQQENFGMEADPELIVDSDAYEEAERRALEEAMERQREQEQNDNLGTSERQTAESERPVSTPDVTEEEVETKEEESTSFIPRTETNSDLPEARLEAPTTSDMNGGRLFMFGGRGTISAKRGDQLWMYQITSGTWELLSGGDIDYSNMCSISKSRASPENGPCIISTSIGFDSLEYYEGKIYLISQERQEDGHQIAVWTFDVDGSRTWSFLGSSSNNGPEPTSFSVFISAYAFANSIYIYRPLEKVGQKKQIAGQIWKFDIEAKSWNLLVAPAVPLEKTATWIVDGILMTHMPGDIRSGVAGNREVPEVRGWGASSEAERMVALDLASGKYIAIEKEEINGMEIKSNEMGVLDNGNTPGKRYGGVKVSSGSFAEGSLYMYGGSLQNKRNPDQRNDLWECKVDISVIKGLF